MEFMLSMDSAPKDRDILVFYDHDADPYRNPHNSDLLTDYGAIAESLDFLDGKGWAIVRWQDRYFELTDEYGDGFWIPGGWFVIEQLSTYELVCNPIYWTELPYIDTGDISEI